MKKLIFSTAIMASLIFTGTGMALTVNTTSDVDTLAGSILGSGITLVGTPTYSGGTMASGRFSNGFASGIGISNGLIMTTGNANLAVGPNNSEWEGQDNDLSGDAQLNGLIPGYETFDASILEFKFSTAGGNLFFNYAFASEEYSEYVNSPFNDVFAFYLDGVNIAMIPGTSTPVSINNVNGGNPSGYYSPDATNPEYFVNNEPAAYDVQYDGFTKVFTASALGLSSGEHTIRLAIADAGDHIYDSAVFIQGRTFSDKETPHDDHDHSEVPEPSTLVLLSSGLVGLSFFRNRKNR